ncbi:iron-sulfur cluster assembly accessory protein [Candidatus Gracilibacteria bacterium]|nr:iron-sulfur cluster assembly accessory protein [Candidatus Gracilibacteria bacterium]
MIIDDRITIDELFELAPDSVIILKNAGLSATGCKADTDRTLAQLFADEKLDQAAQTKILEHLNKQRQVDTTLKTPQSKDLQSEKIQEGNKTYYKLAGMLFSENAYKNLHQLADKKGLRLRLQTGGCSGFKYQFDFFDDPEPDQKTFHLSDKLKIYLDDFTFTRSDGSIVDFKFGLHSSGLEVINPKSKRACSCGISIGF